MMHFMRRSVSMLQRKGVKNGYVMWPIRTAVSGKQMTPGGATEIDGDSWKRRIHCTYQKRY